MNNRIQNKIYKKAQAKLDLNKNKRDKRDYFQQIKEEPFILSGLEKRIFIKRQNLFCIRTDRIIEELKADGKW